MMPEIVSGLKRNGWPDNPGNGGWIAPEYAIVAPIVATTIKLNARNEKTLQKQGLRMWR
ncbi:hypothetical protein [Vibrio albus]|uniref:hypothetical protein n=1 Tax=Vibrio albus TaxID=2200953 RepID=UPI0015E83413|nr:hypothetical protein [Vibrio albus]